ncbi:MAG: TM2 domain-containing protein [Alphaproteobacteria bacterium]|jgi:TM2 domain-containing membrane protein YozV|nr:TM2 domain-containing protein [Alphaproteobacteria bacterium]
MVNEPDGDIGGTPFPVVADAVDPLTIIEADPSKKRRYDKFKKSVLTAYLLWLFLGFFGGHRFYLGYINSGIFLILMSSLGLMLTMIHFIGVFLLFAPGLWLLIDAFIIPPIVRHQNEELVNDILR